MQHAHPLPNMNLGPRTKMPSSQPTITSTAVMLSILPLLPSIRKKASNDCTSKHQRCHCTKRWSIFNRFMDLGSYTYCVPPQILRSTRVRDNSRHEGQITARGHCLSFRRGTTSDGEIVLNAVMSLRWVSPWVKSSILLLSSGGLLVNREWMRCLEVVAILIKSLELVFSINIFHCWPGLRII